MADVLFLDVREPPEVAASGKVPGAVAVPRGLVEFRADPASPMHDKAFDRSKTIVCYCASGGRSALVGKTLKDMGYDKVRNLGGFKGWVDAGRRGREGAREACEEGPDHAHGLEPVALFGEDAGDPALSPPSVRLGRYRHSARCRGDGPLPPVIPVLRFPDGRLMNDSTPLAYALEREHPGRALDRPGRSGLAYLKT